MQAAQMQQRSPGLACKFHQQPRALRVVHPAQRGSRSPRLTASRLHAVAAEGGLDPNLAYAALGLGAASFVSTFVVLPQLYTKNDSWDKDILPALRATGVRSVSPSEALNRASRGRAVILDVRLPDKHAELAARPSSSAPLYIPIQKWDIPSIIRRLGFAFFGVYGTELNPDFVQQAQAAVPKGREVLVLCESGGSIAEKKGNPLGTQSRSLKAVYYLQQAGFTNVGHVSGGLSQWVRDGLPVTGEDEEGDGEPVQQAGAAGTLSNLVSSLTGARQRS